MRHWGDERGCDEGHWHAHTRGLPSGLTEVVGTAEQVLYSRRRLLRRELEFHVCTIHKSAHMKKSRNLFIDPHIYIYIYIYGCMCVDLCVCSWMGGQKRDLIFCKFDSHQSVYRVSLSILARIPHRELCSSEPVRPREKKDERLWSDIQSSGCGARQLRPEARGSYGMSPSRRAFRAVGRQYGIRNGSSRGEDDDQKWFSIFGSCVGFSQSSCESHIYTKIMFKSDNFNVLRFAVLNMCLSFFLRPLCLLFYYFFTAREMPTRLGVRRHNGFHTIRRSAKQIKPTCGLLHIGVSQVPAGTALCGLGSNWKKVPLDTLMLVKNADDYDPFCGHTSTNTFRESPRTQIIYQCLLLCHMTFPKRFEHDWSIPFPTLKTYTLSVPQQQIDLMLMILLLGILRNDHSSHQDMCICTMAVEMGHLLLKATFWRE